MTPEALRAELAKGKIRPAYLLAGAESLMRDESLAALREAVLAGVPADFNFDRIDGANATAAVFQQAVETLPAFSSRRLVWLREPESGRAGGKGIADALAQRVSTLPETTVLVVTAARVDRRSRWVKSFGEPATVVECEAPTGAAALEAFIAAEAERRGVSIEAGAARLLAERVGPELLVLRQELEKAALLAAPATRVTRAHVEASVVALAEEPVWDLTDAIGEGRADDALELLSRLLRSGTPPPVLLGTLASHFRKLLRLRTGGSVPAPAFVQRKLEQQSRRYVPARLLAALRAIHDADLALKGQGGVAPAIAIERLVLGLVA